MIEKALPCLLFGLAGTALAATTANPLTVAAVAGSLMTGAAGNFFHQITDAGQERLIATVFRRNTGIDENHHILHALRLAHLAALEAVLKNYDTAWPTIRSEDQRAHSDRFSKELHRLLIEKTKSVRTGGGISDFEKSVLVALPDALDTALASRGAHPLGLATNDLGRIRGVIETAVLQEILHETATTLTEVPPLFQAAFAAASPDGWFDLFVRDGAARLKSNEEFRSIWTAEKLARLEVIGKAILDEVAEIKTDIRGLIASLPAEIAAQISDRDRLVAELEQVRAKYQETESLVANFLRLMIGQTVPPDQFAATLYANMERWKASGDHLETLDLSTNLIPELATLRQRAEAARREERVEDYWLIIEEIDRIEQDDFEREEEKLREAEAEHKARRDNLARTKELKRDTALATFRIQEAAQVIIEIIDLATPALEAREEAYEQAWAQWYERGRDKGLNLDLAIAIEIARISVEKLIRSDSKWISLNNLGQALRILGQRESGSARLIKSVEVFHAALEEIPRAKLPLLWATMQNNLGNALADLGERESGTKRLVEAVEAYRAALEERTRERAPLLWAATQNNLGTLGITLGKRESGTERLVEAVAACRAALEERARERVPLDWAMTQCNLGNALAALGERESDTKRLIEAVEAFRAALEEWTRERVPLNWAGVQNNLGYTLTMLGRRDSGTEWLVEAIGAIRAAQEEITRERMPLVWAGTQSNLGVALAALGQRESGTKRLVEAVAAYRAALEERTRDRVPLDWATTQNNLGCALRALGERESGTNRLVEAVDAFRAALDVRTRERVPLDWAGTQHNLGNALLAIGERESGTNRLIEAVDAYRAALDVMTRERVPLDWAMTQHNLGNALRTLGERESSTDRLVEAAKVWSSCLEVVIGLWPVEWVLHVCDLRENALVEIRRQSLE